MKHPVLDAIRTRRALRSLTDAPVEREQLECILDAGRWATSGGNRRPHRFVAVQNPRTLHLIRTVSPGMFQWPTAAILICIDWNQVARHQMWVHDPTLYIDVGTAAQNMMLAAHAIGVGSGPVTSFCKEAVRVVLNLPSHLSPEIFICLGQPDPTAVTPQRKKQKLSWRDMTDWERFPE